MKKSLIYVMSLFVAALALVACGTDTPEPETTDVVITFSETQLTLAPGDEQRISYTIAPAGTVVTLEWTSSDEAVATVSKSGVVTAVAVGTATITASYKDAKATCVVTVSDEAIYEQFNIADYGLFGKEFVEIPGTDSIISLTIGDYNCHLGSINLFAWSDGLSYENGVGFAGAGFMVNAEVTVWVIDDDNDPQYNGYYVGGVFYAKENAYGVTPYCANAGVLNEQKYGDWWKSYIAYVADTTLGIDVNVYYEALTGTTISFYNADEDSESWTLATVANLGLGEDENEELQYYADINWLDFTSADRYYGIKVNLTEDGYIDSVVEPYDIRIIAKSYTNMELEISNKLVPSNAHRYTEMPVINRHMPNDKMYRK